MTLSLRSLCVATLLALCSATALAGDWLAHIADDTPVCRLSIPGTHDAATGEGFMPADSVLGNRIAITQTLPIAGQWAAGIRAFDVRPDVRTDSLGRQTLHIFHGEFATRATFAHVLATLRDSLKAHPSEFAILIMRHESSPNRESSRWEEMTDYALAMNSDLLVDFRPDLTVGQMRGRILLLARDEYNEMPRGGYIYGWRHDADVDTTHPAVIKGCALEGRLVLQDFYDMSVEGGLPTKLAAIERLQNLAGNGKKTTLPKHTWYINHTSGYLFTTSGYGPEPVSTTEGYRANAAETNRFLASLIASHKTTTGIVMMDFGGVDRSAGHEVNGLTLTKAIIKSNFSHK